MARLQFFEARRQAVTDSKSILLQMLLLQHIKDCQARGTGDRIPYKGAEEFHAIVETLRNLRSGNHSRKRKRVPDWLAQNDDIRDNILRFESPEVRAQPAKTHLDFISN